MDINLCIIAGDGIGQEVVPAASQVLQVVLPTLKVTEAQAGWAVFEQRGCRSQANAALPPETLKIAQAAGAVLFGAVSSPSYAVEGYKSPIVALRQALDTFANIRPAKKWLEHSDLDLLVVRENTEGLYVGVERQETSVDGGQKVVTERVITQAGTERVARLTFDLARQTQRPVTIVHKANVIRQGDGLWRETCLNIAKAYPEVAVDEVLVDAGAYHLVRTPSRYKLLLCPNLYGDILSDLVSGLADGLGMAPSLSLGHSHAIAEPVHGSAPDIAGQGIANPIAAILSGAMLCRHWWNQPQAAQAIETAIAQVLAQGYRTTDMPQHTLTDEDMIKIVGTKEMTKAILMSLDL